MCLQCDANSIHIGSIGDLSVQISTSEKSTWKKGKVGIVHCNDPDIIFDEIDEWIKDPTFEKDDLVELTESDYQISQKYIEVSYKISTNLKTDIQTGHRFYENLLKDGYDPKIHGYQWASYFQHKVAEFLEKYNQEIDEWEKQNRYEV